MANVIFILGAGASRQGGAPLMFDFLDVADNLRRTELTGAGTDYFDQVFTAIGRMQAIHSKAQLDLNNIESVFNAFVMAKILNKFPGDENFSGDAAEVSLKRLIAKTLETTMQFPVLNGRVSAPKPYPAFADLIRHLRQDAHPSQSVAVLTFNYDLGADYALHNEGIGPNYCLTDNQSNQVPLLKLHGSMNWAVCRKCEEVVPWTLTEFFKSFSYHHLSDSQKVRLNVWSQFDKFSHCDTKVDPMPFLVPPTWNKTGHQETIKVVWQRAAKEMAGAENIFIIGYSLPETDAFFRMLYAIGVVGDMPLKRIWVYNPDGSGAVENRFRQLLGPAAEARFKYFPVPFAEAIASIKVEFPSRRR